MSERTCANCALRASHHTCIGCVVETYANWTPIPAPKPDAPKPDDIAALVAEAREKLKIASELFDDLMFREAAELSMKLVCNLADVLDRLAGERDALKDQRDNFAASCRGTDEKLQEAERYGEIMRAGWEAVTAERDAAGAEVYRLKEKLRYRTAGKHIECDNCKYSGVNSKLEPCCYCAQDMSEWTPQEKED